MVRISALILYLLIVFVSACRNNQKALDSLPLIDIEANMNNMQQINLSRFASDITYIPLATQNDLTFAGIFDCEFSDKYFLVKDLRKCFLYDYDGNLVSKIGTQGRGPGEFRYAVNVGFGPQNKIYMQSLYDLIEYYLDGSFSKKYEKAFLFNNDYIGSWLPIKDSLILGKFSSSLGNEKYKAIILNKNGDVKE